MEFIDSSCSLMCGNKKRKEGLFHYDDNRYVASVVNSVSDCDVGDNSSFLYKG